MKAELLAPLSQAFATFAGAVFVLVGIWYRERVETRSRAKNARVQIVAEVRALLDLIELNEYVRLVDQLIEALKAGATTRYLNFQSNRSFVSVYEANLQNLGYLDGSASEVVRFYTILLSSLEDKDQIIQMGKRLDERRAAGETVEKREQDQLIRQHEFFAVKLKETVRLGNKICQDLGSHQPMPSKLRLPGLRGRAHAPALDPVALAQAQLLAESQGVTSRDVSH